MGQFKEIGSIGLETIGQYLKKKLKIKFKKIVKKQKNTNSIENKAVRYYVTEKFLNLMLKEDCFVMYIDETGVNNELTKRYAW